MNSFLLSHLGRDGFPVRRLADFLPAEPAGEMGEEGVPFRALGPGSLVRILAPKDRKTPLLSFHGEIR